MKVTVTIHLKNGVLDPQGKAVEGALHSIGFSGAKDVHVGKVIMMDLPDETKPEEIQEMCEKLLANPVIEDYTIDTHA